jgi:ribose-phosphate pyrophosphokinase
MSIEFNPDNFVVLACKAAMPFAKGVIEKTNTKFNHKNYKESGKKEDTEVIELGNLLTSTFPGGEIQAKLNKNTRKRSVHLFQCFRHLDEGPYLSHDFMELLVVLDALKRSSAKDITLYTPFLPYQRQEKKKHGREPISARLVFDLIEAAAGNKLDRIVTADNHTEAGPGFANVPVDNLITWPLFALYIQQIMSLAPNNFVIVSPDAGGANRAESFALTLNTNYAIINKRRDQYGNVSVNNLIGDVNNKTAVIIDDIIATGGSLIESQDLLFRYGANQIVAFATHGIFCKDKKTGIPAEKRFYDANIQVITTDSIPQKHSTYYASCWKWLKGILSLSSYFADALYCNETGESLKEKMSEYELQVSKNIGDISSFLIPNQPVEIPTN